jgi:hypothetical protein
MEPRKRDNDIAEEKPSEAEPEREAVEETASDQLSTAAGSVAGAAAGAAIGMAGGPAASIVGGAIGAVAGSLASHTTAERVNPELEDEYWRETYRTRPYINRDFTYDDYGPAYRYGWEARTHWADRQFDEVEPQLAKDWIHTRGISRLGWDHAEAAARDAWDRIAHRRDYDLP